MSTIHAGGLAIKEPTHLGGKDDQTRPDAHLVLDGRQVLVDVTVRHPTCKTNIQHGSARHQLAAAHKGESEKKAKYTAMAKSQQAEFICFAMVYIIMICLYITVCSCAKKNPLAPTCRLLPHP